MIFVIVPLGEEAKDKLYWVVRVIMYTAGSMVGASLPALLLGFAGQGIRALIPGANLGWVVAFLGVVALIFALQELGIIKLPMPQVGWQVPKSWQKSSRLTGSPATYSRFPRYSGDCPTPLTCVTPPGW